MNELLTPLREFYDSGKTLDIEFRLAQLKKLEASIQRNKPQILEALAADLGRGEILALSTELYPLAFQLALAKSKLKKWVKKHNRRSSPLFPLSRCYLKYKPYGLSLVITPWNYPFSSSLAALVGSIAAGNCTILRPTTQLGESKKVLKKIVTETFSEDYVKYVDLNHGEIADLVGQGIDYLYFMGRTSSGIEMGHRALGSGVPFSLHLSGKCPAIIHSDAQIERSVRRLAWAKFTNVGESCTAPDYLFVHESILEKVVGRLKKTIEEFYGQDPQSSSDYARLKDAASVQRLECLLESDQAVAGGTADVEDRYFAPTVVLHPADKSPLRQEEIFGPILPVFSYKNIEEPISFIKSRSAPLAIYLFSKDRKVANQIFRSCPTGQFCFNDAMVQGSAKESSIGGVSFSGVGRYGSFESFKSFSNEVFVFEQTSLFDVFGRFPPYTSFHKKIIEFFS